MERKERWKVKEFQPIKKQQNKIKESCDVSRNKASRRVAWSPILSVYKAADDRLAGENEELEKGAKYVV